MKRLYYLWISTLLLVFALGVATRPWLASATAVAAPSEQGLMQLPVDFYILMNQPGDLWLVGMSLQGVNLREIDLSNANLRGANLTNANLRNANLSGTHFVGSNLTNADLRDANLTDADLTAANLAGADLRDTDFSNAILTDAIFNRARYSAETIWPEGFDVAATNAELVE